MKGPFFQQFTTRLESTAFVLLWKDEGGEGFEARVKARGAHRKPLAEVIL